MGVRRIGTGGPQRHSSWLRVALASIVRLGAPALRELQLCGRRPCGVSSTDCRCINAVNAAFFRGIRVRRLAGRQAGPGHLREGVFKNFKFIPTAF